MKVKTLHDWPRRLSDATRIQRELLAPQVDLYGSIPDQGLIVGIECVFSEPYHKVFCAAVLMRYPGFTEVERSLAEDDLPFPFNLDLMSFREGKTICRALEGILAQPDILMISGDGINSPSGVGVATHMGILYDTPSIGCFRRLRTAEKPRVRREKGSQTPISQNGRQVAIALRSKANVKSIYVSPGYKIGFDDSVRLVFSMLRGFRTPEPIRVSHLLATQRRTEFVKEKESGVGK